MVNSGKAEVLFGQPPNLGLQYPIVPYLIVTSSVINPGKFPIPAEVSPAIVYGKENGYIFVISPYADQQRL